MNHFIQYVHFLTFSYLLFLAVKGSVSAALRIA